MRMNIKQLAVAAFMLLASTAANAQQGAWKGELDVFGTKLPLVFNFTADGCSLDSPAQGAKGIPAQKSVAEDGTIKVTIAMIGATFEGKQSDNRIEGVFSQGGANLPLVLTPGTAEVKRPQTPIAPFPYKEESVSFDNAGFKFNGTLTMPSNCTRKTPVVLLVTGSGQQNRDEELFDHKPFAVIADALARQGIASLRYDDRGWGDKSVDFTAFTTADFKQDASAGLQLLRSRFDRVGVLGHSEGGTIALLLGAEGQADFVVSLAGMAVSGKETILYQNNTVLAPLQLPEDVRKTCTETIEKALNEMAAGKSVEDFLNDNAPQELRSMLEQTLKQTDNNYIRYFLTIDASRELPKIKCPVLALNGTKDVQVNCEKNLAALERGLTNCRHTVKKIDGLNHLFQHCQTGNVMEYQQIEETIAPEVLQTVATWITENYGK